MRVNARPGRPPAPLRVLLVDELGDDREIYGLGLRSLGLDVIITGSRTAVAAACTTAPAVVVLHLEDGGWELCDQLRRACGHIPVIAITAAVRPDAENRRRARGTVNCVAFVGKPCTHVDLAWVIGRVAAGERGIEATTGYALRHRRN